MKSINDWCKESYTKAAHLGWHDTERTVLEEICLMHSELSEACEEHRSGHSPTEVYISSGKPEGVPVELADCVIRIFDFCGKHKIDLEDVLRMKLEYNNSRGYRHGNKVI